MLDQGLDADLQADIIKYVEDLVNSGLRQRLISLIKVSLQSFYVILVVFVDALLLELFFCIIFIVETREALLILEIDVIPRPKSRPQPLSMHTIEAMLLLTFKVEIWVSHVMRCILDMDMLLHLFYGAVEFTIINNKYDAEKHPFCHCVF